jgi:hypothetical protein
MRKRFGIEEGTMVTAEENHQRRLSTLAQKLTSVRQPNANFQRVWLCRERCTDLAGGD